MTPQYKAELQGVLRRALFSSLDKRANGWMPEYDTGDDCHLDGHFNLDEVSLDLVNAVEEFQKGKG